MDELTDLDTDWDVSKWSVSIGVILLIRCFINTFLTVIFILDNELQ